MSGLLSYDIKENPEFPQGATLKEYAPIAYGLTLEELQPTYDQRMLILPPPGFLLAKTVEKHDIVHCAIPGSVPLSTQAQWSGAGAVIRSRRLWSPGKTPADANGHSTVLLDAYLNNVARAEYGLPAGSWMGIKIDESALTRGLVRVIHIAERPEKEFEPIPYLQYLGVEKR